MLAYIDYASIKNMDKVDILVATYNTKKEFLEKQLESIILQTYKNIHIYISDDCSSSEETKIVLKQFAKKDERITLIFQEKNLGLNPNWNFLLSLSKSEYIMFSDHDDIWNLDKVEKSLEKIKQSNVDMVYTNCEQIDQNENILHSSYFKYKNVPLVKGKNKIAFSRCIGIGCSQIITKNVKEQMIPFTKNVIAHDWLASFIANQNKGIDYIEEPLFKYRLHATNVFGGRSLEQNLNRWKKENGKSYKSYLKYRDEAIKRAYLGGAEMGLDYIKMENLDINNKKINLEKYLNKLIKYYQNIEKTKFLNLNILPYFKYLYGKNLTKKMIKEIVLFHFPIIGYIIFANT